MPIFIRSEKNFRFKQNSKVIIEDIKNSNILFVGDFKTLGLLGEVLTDVLPIDFLPLQIYSDKAKKNIERTFEYPGNSFDSGLMVMLSIIIS